MSNVKVFFRQAATVFSGAAIGNALLIIFLPAVTSLYSIESFGIYGFMLAATATVGPLATGKLEMAVVVGDDKDTLPLLLLSIVFLASFVCFVYVTLFILEGVVFINNETLTALLMHRNLFILAIISFGLQIILEGMANRGSEYLTISISRVLTPVVFLLLALVFSSNEHTTYDLLKAFALSPIISVVLLTRLALIRLKLSGKNIVSRIRQVAFDYRKFWLISCPTGFLDNLAASSPIYLLGIFYTPQMVAYYTLAIRVGYGPLSMVARSLSQVNFRTTSHLYNSGARPIGHLKKVMRPYLLSIIPLFFVDQISKDLIVIFFGVEWEMAGEILTILLPIFLFK